MSIRTPYIHEIGYRTYAINEFGMNAMYLCVGNERALLIDTGAGTCDLKGIVERLTDLPYDVVLTHGHVDHAGGIDAFEKIYMHKDDMEMARTLTYEERLGYAKVMHESDREQAYAFNEEQVRVWRQIPELIAIEEGYVFDLGDRKLEVYHVPGHTPGSISLLDRKNRINFSGDACNTNTVMFAGSITELYHSAEKLKALEPYFDRDFNGHIGYAGEASCLSMPWSVREDVMHICRSILDGTGEVTEQPFLGGISYGVSYHNARVVYTPETVMKRDGEEPVEV